MKFFIPSNVGPSKLDLLIAQLHPQPLEGESATKLDIIVDVIRIGKLLGHPVPTPKEFYALYDASLGYLEALQHQAQVDYNTRVYHRSSSIQGADF
jgi:hypothetical protein